MCVLIRTPAGTSKGFSRSGAVVSSPTVSTTRSSKPGRVASQR